MVRVEVRTMANVLRIDDQFFVRKARLRMLLDYWREVGIASVLRKIASRRGESLRNTRFLSVGFGIILESEGHVGLAVGTAVAFVATSNPAWVERVVVPVELCVPIRESVRQAERTLIPVGAVDCPDVRNVAVAAGWDPESGAPPPSAASEWIHRNAQWVARLQDGELAGESLPPFEVSPVRLRRVTTHSVEGPTNRSAPTLGIVGFGNYVKTVAMPELRHGLKVKEVFELDPLILPPTPSTWDWEVSSGPSEGSASCDAYLLAGFHHTHGPLASRILRSGRWAIIEKPIVTTRDQLGELRTATEQNDRLISCFQKRYCEFTAKALTDLTDDVARPISYACIVFEVPLPRLHWYSWPASGSRLLSNGCHWIDHFLWLNRGSEVVALSVRRGEAGTVQLWIELQNAASFSMVLTEQGSGRLGLQDLVDLRAGDRTVRIRNSTHYEFEGADGEVRRTRQLRTAPYRRMYRDIARRIGGEGTGDDLGHTFRSATTVLDAEEALARLSHGQAGVIAR